MIEKISILHTNDLHAKYDEWVKLASVIRWKRSSLLDKGFQTILIDGGDHFDIGVLECAILKGQLNVDLLNNLNFDALGVGNNELSRFSIEQLNRLSKNTTAPWLLANVRQENGEKIGNMKSSTLIEVKGGLKVGIIGVTHQLGNLYEEAFGFKNFSTLEVIKEEVIKLRSQKANLIVLISHCGYDEDLELAKELSGHVDVIVGSHTHTELFTPVKENGIIIVQAGSYGKYLGELSMEFDTSENKIVNFSGELHSTETNTKNDVKQLFIVKSARNQITSYMEQILKELDEPLERDNVVCMIAKAMKQYYRADIGLMIGAAANAGLSTREVKVSDIYQICSSLICVAHLKMKGSQILGLIHERTDPAIFNNVIPGYGYRPRNISIGKIQFDGVTWEENNGEVVNVKINEEKLEQDRWYTVGTGEHLHIPEACGYPSLKGTEVIEIDDYYYVRDVLIEYLKQKLDKKQSIYN